MFRIISEAQLESQLSRCDAGRTEKALGVEHQPAAAGLLIAVMDPQRLPWPVCRVFFTGALVSNKGGRARLGKDKLYRWLSSNVF
jgi:hypothetical protein